MAETRTDDNVGTGSHDNATGRADGARPESVPSGLLPSGDALKSLPTDLGAADLESASEFVDESADFGDGVDDGPGRGGGKGHLPERRCLVSGDRKPVTSMIRFVRGPDGCAVPDLAGKLPGRGMWLSANREIVNTAVKRGLFSRAARAKTRAEPDLAARVEAGLVSRLVDLISLARRAGEAVVGFEKSKSALNSGSAVVLIAASDCAEDGREKLARLANALNRSEERVSADIARLSMLSAAELGGAFARDQAIHAVILRGGLADKIKLETARLGGFRQENGDGPVESTS